MKQSIAGRRKLGDTLEEYVAWLCESEEIRSATAELKAAMDSRDRTKAASAAEKVRQCAKEIEELTKLIDQVDPHVLDQAQVKSLRKLGPTKLVADALHEGKLRERRMLLQAMEADTNRRLAWVAFIAAMVALSIPFIEWWLR
jgi:hypothetical protein